MMDDDDKTTTMNDDDSDECSAFDISGHRTRLDWTIGPLLLPLLMSASLLRKQILISNSHTQQILKV